MRQPTPLHLFEGFGIELEYMLVDAETLAVLPLTDQVLRAVAGSYVSEVDMGNIAWSNELVLHVIELKTNGPAAALCDLPAAFAANIAHINMILASLGGRLMPSAMHPWMDPRHDMRLWPHDYNPVYEAFNRIFDCRGHGWANLQSVHLNLPFADDTEFARLHAAIRLLLPLLPALAASSPFLEGQASGWLDTRLEMYRNNARRIPSVSGKVIPEAVFTQHDYEHDLLGQIYHDIAPYDPAGILQHEWLNARGAIARFDRNAIEIRVLDIQECPLADLAICSAIVAVLQALVNERWCSLAQQQAWEVEPLQAILLETIRSAEQAVLHDSAYLHTFGFPAAPPCTTGDMWHYLLESTQMLTSESPWSYPLQTILHQGPLARRLLQAVGEAPTQARLQEVYRLLCTCLATDSLFTAASYA
jgi:gamma-glutamyl:cysteine ligase YbdK (ATP-grasp superfamily)